MRAGVYVHDGVGGDFRVVLLNPVLDRLVEVFLRGLFHDDRLGERGRMRLRRRVDEGFRGWTVDGEEDLRRRLRARRSGEGTQTKHARHVGMKCKFGGVQMTSFIEG